MKRVKQVVAVLVWCVVSVGCVAGEVKQPAVTETPAAPVEALIQEKSKSSGDDEITITTHIDPTTGNTYQELTGIFTVEKFNYERAGSYEHYVYMNNIRISKGSYPDSKTGKFILPDDVAYGEWDKLIGRKANVFCIVKENPNKNNVCVKECSKQGSFEFKFDYHCSLEPGNKYFIKF